MSVTCQVWGRWLCGGWVQQVPPLRNELFILVWGVFLFPVCLLL